jgi:hypothetical protein
MMTGLLVQVDLAVLDGSAGPGTLLNLLDEAKPTKTCLVRAEFLKIFGVVLDVMTQTTLWSKDAQHGC